MTTKEVQSFAAFFSLKTVKVIIFIIILKQHCILLNLQDRYYFSEMY